jgi:hypothetical protein
VRVLAAIVDANDFARRPSMAKPEIETPSAFSGAKGSNCNLMRGFLSAEIFSVEIGTSKLLFLRLNSLKSFSKFPVGSY